MSATVKKEKKKFSVPKLNPGVIASMNEASASWSLSQSPYHLQMSDEMTIKYGVDERHGGSTTQLGMSQADSMKQKQIDQQGRRALRDKELSMNAVQGLYAMGKTDIKQKMSEFNQKNFNRNYDNGNYMEKQAHKSDSSSLRKRGRPRKDAPQLFGAITSAYRGVSWDKAMGTWRVKINCVHVGYFDGELDAAKAYDEASIILNNYQVRNANDLNLPNALEEYQNAIANNTLGEFSKFASYRDTHSRGSSDFRGVLWDKTANLWRAKIKSRNKTIYLGLFKDEVQAGRAYDRAARSILGVRAILNFPGDYKPWRIPYNMSETSFLQECFLKAVKILENANWRKEFDVVIREKLDVDLFLVGGARYGKVLDPQTRTSYRATVERLSTKFKVLPEHVGARIVIISSEPKYESMFETYKNFLEEDSKSEANISNDPRKPLWNAKINSRVRSALMQRVDVSNQTKIRLQDRQSKNRLSEEEQKEDEEAEIYLRIIDQIEKQLIGDSESMDLNPPNIPQRAMDALSVLTHKLVEHVQTNTGLSNSTKCSNYHSTEELDDDEPPRKRSSPRKRSPV